MNEEELQQQRITSEINNINQQKLQLKQLGNQISPSTYQREIKKLDKRLQRARKKLLPVEKQVATRAAETQYIFDWRHRTGRSTGYYRKESTSITSNKSTKVRFANMDPRKPPPPKRKAEESGGIIATACRFIPTVSWSSSKTPKQTPHHVESVFAMSSSKEQEDYLAEQKELDRQAEEAEDEFELEKKYGSDALAAAKEDLELQKQM